MYRARVESVSGLQVRAGGKWLTCIGNRPVKVGDFIWTDGRCVYGHDRESQAPFVFAPPPKDDLAIPIQIVSDTAETLYTYRKNKLEQVSTGDFAGGLLNDTKGHVYNLNALTADAANIDKDGNIYTLNFDSRWGYSNWNWDHAVQPERINTTASVSIQKNGNTVNKIPLDNLLQSAFDKAQDSAAAASVEALLGEGDGEIVGDGYDTRVFEYEYRIQYYYAFIENDKRWATIFSVVADVDSTIIRFANGDTWAPPYTPILKEVPCGFCRHCDYYYLDSTGKCSPISQTHWFGMYRFYVVPYTLQRWDVVEDYRDFSGLDGKRFQLQDNYYYTINQPTGIDFHYDANAGRYANVKEGSITYNVYTPNDRLLFDYNQEFTVGVFPLGLYSKNLKALSRGIGLNFLACKLSNGKSLVVANAELFLCEGGELSKLVDGHCLNYRLRPMKKYKRWWERVQNLDEGGG